MNIRHRVVANLAVSLLIFCVVVGTALDVGADERPPTAPQVELSEMVTFEADTFQMGVEFETPSRYGDRWFIDQVPAHAVHLDTFRLDVFPVTVEEFALFLTYSGGERHYSPNQPIERVDGGYLAESGAEQLPIHYVSWEAADHYCRWAGKRLPTEAQWERAAAGTEGREYPWGDDGPNCRRANYFTGSTHCEEEPDDVAARPDGQTPDGVYGMAGNVAEWTADYYGPYPEDGADRENPTGPDDGELRTVRGGGFLDGSRWLRTRSRWGANPAHSSRSIGFRCAHADDLDDDGAPRGELAPPADEERQQRDWPPVPAAAGPDVVADGFFQPGAVTYVAGEYFLLDERGGALVAVDESSGEIRYVAEEMGRPVGLAAAGGHLFVTDRDEGEVWHFDSADDSAALIADGLDAPTHIAADETAVFWYSDGQIWRYPRSETQTDSELFADELLGVTALELSEDKVIVTTDGGDDEIPEETFVATLVRQPESSTENGEELSILLDEELFGDVLYPSHLAFDRSVEQAYVVIRFRSFPNTAWICRLFIDDGSYGCGTYAPRPRQGPLVVRDGDLFWPGRSAVMTYHYGSVDTFRYLGSWTRVGGIYVGPDDVVWTDRQTGRLYRTTP